MTATFSTSFRDHSHFDQVKDFLKNPYLGMQTACWFHQTNNNISNNRNLTIHVQVCQKEIPSSNRSPMGVGGGAKWYFKKEFSLNCHIMRRKKFEATYVDNRFQNYDPHSLFKGNSKFSLFTLSPLAKCSQVLLWRIAKLTASQISNTEPLHSA